MEQPTIQQKQIAIFNAIIWNSAKDLVVIELENGGIDHDKLNQSIINLAFPSGVKMMDARPFGAKKRRGLTQSEIDFARGFCFAKFHNGLCF